MKSELEQSKKGVLSDRVHIERVAKRLFTQHMWVEKYGRPLYYLRCGNKIKQILTVRDMPDEWDIIQFRRRWYVYLSSDKIGKNINQLRAKLTPLAVQRIRETDFTIIGVQRKLAKELGVHESYLSRVRRGILRTDNVKPRKFENKDKSKLFVSRAEVTDFFERMQTGTEFYNRYHAAYQISNIQRVYDMCSGRNYAKFPNGWFSVRVSDHWLIYSDPQITSRRDSSPR